MASVESVDVHVDSPRLDHTRSQLPDVEQDQRLNEVDPTLQQMNYVLNPSTDGTIPAQSLLAGSNMNSNSEPLLHSMGRSRSYGAVDSPHHQNRTENVSPPQTAPVTSIAPTENLFAFPSDMRRSEQSDDSELTFGYMPGMNVEITPSEQLLPTQGLPEGLRHVMLHVVASRPSEEVKFRRLRYRMESDGIVPDNPFMPRARRSQRPPRHISRQQLRRTEHVQQLAPNRSTSVSSLPHNISRETSREQTSVEALLSETNIQPQDDVAPINDASGGSCRSSVSSKSILVVLAVNDLMASMSLSILAPFFPKEARQKGISDAVSGWVFGVFALSQCIASPIFGKLLPSVGAKFLSQAGQFFAGGCTILFGMLQYVSTENQGLLFLTYCIVLRIFMAIGCAANATAAFAIAARAFPDNPATVFGLLETAAGFGLMLGPALGGVLYEVGGFVAPFAAIGTAMVLSVPVGICVLPSYRKEKHSSTDTVSSVQDLLRIPAVTITAMAAFIACLAWVMPDPTLEPHLSQFELSPTLIGLIFLLMSACFAVCAPVWGWVADNVPDSSPMMVIGFAGTGLGFLVLGPTPLFGLPHDFSPLWLTIVGLMIIGLMISLALVPTYDKILDAAEKAGIPDTFANCSILAGVWNSAYSFGEFVGPVLAGWMMGKVGFSWTMSLAAALCFLMSFIMLILYMYERKFGPTGVIDNVSNQSAPVPITDPSETTPLLSSVHT